MGIRDKVRGMFGREEPEVPLTYREAQIIRQQRYRMRVRTGGAITPELARRMDRREARELKDRILLEKGLREKPMKEKS